MTTTHLSSDLNRHARRWRLLLLAGLSIPIFVALILSPPMAQDPAYHDFADQRTLLGIPHMWNVMSNLPFAVVGLVGCWLLMRPGAADAAFESSWESRAYWVFFVGELLTCFGSAYYHANPNNHTLVWDRLVFSLLLTAMFTIVITEYVSPRAGKLMLIPMVLLGLGSVLQWHASELAGHGDLRLYIAVQFYPMLVMPLILWLFPSRYNDTRWFALLWICYAAAKAAEYFDAGLYQLNGFWSGHTLRHFIAALATLLLLLARRRRISPRKA